MALRQQENQDMTPNTKNKARKLRPLVITMGSKRKTYIEALFNEPCMKEHFEPPSFSPGVPSRGLRSCYSFLEYASRTGIIPQHEWDAIAKAKAEIVNDEKRDNNDHLGILDCLNDIPVLEGRRGSEEDVKRHFCRELWQKAKGINRGRNVLGCLFAHLIAMKTLVEGDYDFILEDNVRAPISTSSLQKICCEQLKIDDGSQKKNLMETKEIMNDNEANTTPPCATRIRDAIEASQEWEVENRKKCHLRYYGWLGSRPNLEFIINTHCPRTRYKRKGKTECESSSIFPFPVTSDIETHQTDEAKLVTLKEEETGESNTNIPKKAGGTPIWGAFAYWISKEGHRALIDSLQKDVGSLLWKGKRMRYHVVKPIDKVMPRKIMAAFGSFGNIEDGRECIHVATDPAFFRAPMLTSQIHSQWDAEFCRSTEYQMLSCRQKSKHKSSCGHVASDEVWDSLWLTEQEREIIKYKKTHQEWLTLNQLSKISLNN